MSRQILISRFALVRNSASCYAHEVIKEGSPIELCQSCFREKMIMARCRGCGVALPVNRLWVHKLIKERTTVVLFTVPPGMTIVIDRCTICSGVIGDEVAILFPPKIYFSQKQHSLSATRNASGALPKICNALSNFLLLRVLEILNFRCNNFRCNYGIAALQCRNFLF